MTNIDQILVYAIVTNLLLIDWIYYGLDIVLFGRLLVLFVLLIIVSRLDFNLSLI